MRFRYERVWWKPWTWFPTGAEIQLEAEWSTSEVDLLIASRDYEAGIGAHGHPLDEAMSPDANPADPAAPYYYAAEEPVTDWVERERTLAADRWRKQNEGQSMAGLVFPISKKYRRS